MCEFFLWNYMQHIHQSLPWKVSANPHICKSAHLPIFANIMDGNQVSHTILTVFAELLNDIHDIFIVVNRDWEIIYANQKACRYFNEDQELAGKNLMREFPVYKDSSLIQ